VIWASWQGCLMGKLSADAVGQRPCRGFRGAVGGIERITGHRRHYKERDARRRAAREIYAAPAQWRWVADPGGPAVRSFHAWRWHAFLSCCLSSLAGWPDCRYQAARSRCGGLSSGRHNVRSICWHRQRDGQSLLTVAAVPLSTSSLWPRPGRHRGDPRSLRSWPRYTRSGRPARPTRPPP